MLGLPLSLNFNGPATLHLYEHNPEQKNKKILLQEVVEQICTQMNLQLRREMLTVTNWFLREIEEWAFRHVRRLPDEARETIASPRKSL